MNNIKAIKKEINYIIKNYDINPYCKEAILDELNNDHMADYLKALNGKDYIKFIIRIEEEGAE